jgi:transcriptional regulator
LTDDATDSMDRDPPPAEEMTRRQRLADLLSMESRSVESLAAEFRTSPRDVEADLRSLEKTLRREKKRLAVTPAKCRKCGFVFEERGERRFTSPSKCPECRGNRIEPAVLKID